MTRNRELLLKCKRPMRKHFSARRSTGAAAGIALIAAAALAAILLCIGCGNNFRPVVNPILQAGGDPCGTPGFVHVIAQNPSGAAGSASQIDICDFDASDMSIGRAPLRGALVNGKVFIANSTDNSLSNYTPGAPPGTADAASLTGGTDPVFVGGTETGSSAFAYAALAGSSAVAVVDTNTNPPSLKTTVPLGHTPVALAELFPPNASKVYVADSDGKVSVIQTAALNQTPATISVGGNPVWITANPNNSAVYVLDPTNTRVDIIDPGAPTSTVPNSVSVGTNPTFMYFDSHLQRLYVTNTGDNPGTISAFDASGGTTLIPLGCSPTPSCTSKIPLNTSTTSAIKPVSLTTVHTSSCDGCVYIANSGSNNVTVLDRFLNVIKTIAVGTTPVSTPVSIAASSDGTRVYTANNGSSNISIIGTASNTVITTIAAPFQDPTCNNPGNTCPSNAPRNAPVWVVGY